MDAIAKEAGVSKQTVYSHFTSKDQLFEMCIGEKCKQMYLIEEVFSDQRPLSDVLMEFGLTFHNFMLSHEAQSTFKAAVSQQDSHPDLAKAYLAAGPERTSQRFAEFLVGRIKKGELKSDINIEFATSQFLLLCHGRGVVHQQLGMDLEESEVSKHTYISSCVVMFLLAYSAKE